MKYSGLGLALGLSAQVALSAVFVLEQEMFGSDPGGTYTTLGGGNFNGSSGFESGFGNTTADIENGVPGGPATGGGSPSGNGSFEGSFDAIGVPAPEFGTLRITDTGFLTDYSSTYPGYASYSLGFAFYGSVLPADLTLTIGNGMDTYIYNAAPQVTSAGSWHSVYVPFSSGWFGSGSSISSPLNGMTYIDVTWSRNGTGAQQYYFDDFTLFGDDTGGGGGGGSAVPEPNTLLLLSLAGMCLVSARRHLRKAGRIT